MSGHGHRRVAAGDAARQDPPGGVSRRRFIVLAAWGTALATFPRVAGAARPHVEDHVRSLSLHNLHTEERLSLTYWERGSYVPAALAEIDAILRDHRTGEIRSISPQLLDLVSALTRRLGGAEPVRVISGYRSTATNQLLHEADPAQVAARSLHLSGEALDFSLAGRSLRKVRDAALALRGGGVGYYPRTGFVHVDVGTVRRW